MVVNFHLKRSTWTLIGGLAAAGIVLAAGMANARRLEAKAIAADVCDLPVPTKEQRDLAAATTKPFDPEAYLNEYTKAEVAHWLAAGNKSTGNPDKDAVLADADAKKAEATRIADCHAKLGKVPDDAKINRSTRWPKRLDALIAILGAMPWAWSLLLRSIAELREAIRGNPPGG